MNILNVIYKLATDKASSVVPVLADRNGAIGRPPNIRLTTDNGDPVASNNKTPGVTGSIANKAGGSASGSGFTPGAATITGGVITAIPVSSGGSGYPANARLKVSVTSDGTGFAGYAQTSGSGVVTGIVITNGGTGATTVSSCTIDAGTTTPVVFDLGPDWAQYSVATLGTMNAGSCVYRIACFVSDDGSNRVGMSTMPTLGTEAWIDGLSGSGNPTRDIRVTGRFIHADVLIGLSTGATAKLYLTAFSGT